MSQQPGDLADRILDAALRVYESRGLRRGTLAQVASAAGVGRATLYRYFPGKDALLSALVVREARTLFAMLDDQLGSLDDPAEMLVRGLTLSYRHLRTHPLLQRILAGEPEALLPSLTVRAEPLLSAAVDFATPYIERAVKARRMAPVDPPVAAEWAARMLLSLILTPSVTANLESPDELTAFVTWLAPVHNEGGTA